jgi:hypothetical protein
MVREVIWLGQNSEIPEGKAEVVAQIDRVVDAFKGKIRARTSSR